MTLVDSSEDLERHAQVFRESVGFPPSCSLALAELERWAGLRICSAGNPQNKALKIHRPTESHSNPKPLGLALVGWGAGGGWNNNWPHQKSVSVKCGRLGRVAKPWRRRFGNKVHTCDSRLFTNGDNMDNPLLRTKPGAPVGGLSQT